MKLQEQIRNNLRKSQIFFLHREPYFYNSVAIDHQDRIL